ncbi:hypothetical protein QA584_17110 [Anaerocolumna sp. AGMB13025]|uniref:hypothetical protein n=1 Tax=Anaerocolumna sp. AGMB13025 TaxID=3039116 RepID=UPI00241EC6A0|nr:hypothetical protein [Anaerocolumna sp. AGMB13025]WFR55319.1 hypothetical protein QA584_17110 [Anaerocolumna sp. AGMB13025]
MIKTKFVKALILGICVSTLSAGVALAETVDKKAVEITTQNVTAPGASVTSDGEASELAAVSGLAQDPETTASSDAAIDPAALAATSGLAEVSQGGAAPSKEAAAKDDAFIAKADEINKIIFEDKIKDIESKDIAIMSTVPVDGVVEIGILPFTKENIDYIYSLTGKDQVKVVEGVEPELMATSGIATDGVMTAFGDSEVLENADDGNVKVVSVGDNNSFEKPVSNEKNSIMTMAGIAGVAALLGGAVLMSQKKKTTR